MTRSRSNLSSTVSTWRYIEAAQREGYHRTTAWGAYLKAGGKLPSRKFRYLWDLASSNPFRFRGVS